MSIGFGIYSVKRKLENSAEVDTTLECELSTEECKLLKVNTYADGFYDKVLGYTDKYMRDNIQKFCKAIKQVKEADVKPFWRPVMDPSLDQRDNIVFKEGMEPAIGRSFYWWKDKVEKMTTLDGRKWCIGTEYQYYAFLVFLINSLVDEGWEISKAIDAVVINSVELGHYGNSENAKHTFEFTGARNICGCYDLANTLKLLRCTNNEYGGFWTASGFFDFASWSYPLAELWHYHHTDEKNWLAVAWLVLE